MVDTGQNLELRSGRMEPTTTRKLASLILDEPVADWVAAQRAKGLSWRLIAHQLRDVTDGQVDVTHESIRTWSTTIGPAE